MTSTPEGTVRVAREGARGYHLIDRAKYDADPKSFTLVDADAKPIKAGPLDHDENGKAGGTTAVPKNPELAELRKQYKAKFGKGASPRWDADTIRAKLAVEPSE